VFLHNASNAVTAVVDSLGGVEETVHYGLYGSPQISNRFGNPVEFSSVANAMGFGGLYHDFESGFLLAGARHFDPGLGRFLTREESLFPAELLELNSYVRGGLPGMTGEVYGPGSALRQASYLEPFRVRIPRRMPVDGLPAKPEKSFGQN
jgi:RHS repeat-associated protein